MSSTSAAISEFWIFRCCITPQSTSKRPRLRIDRSMIGNPSNFQHLSHVGRGELELPNDQLAILQSQMQGKGGYHYQNLQRCSN